MKRYLKALFSAKAHSCLIGVGIGGGILGGCIYDSTGAVVGGLAGAALGAWCVVRSEKLERR
jgi:hypothetical protein